MVGWVGEVGGLEGWLGGLEGWLGERGWCMGWVAGVIIVFLFGVKELEVGGGVLLVWFGRTHVCSKQRHQHNSLTISGLCPVQCNFGKEGIMHAPADSH